MAFHGFAIVSITLNMKNKYIVPKIKMCRIEHGIQFLAASGNLSTSNPSSGNVDNLPQYSGEDALDGSGGMAGAKAGLWPSDGEDQLGEYSE